MNTQHTATPWGIEDTGGAIWVGPMRRDGIKIAEIVFGIDIHGHTACSKADHRANATFIVRACNNHEALVAALERIAAYDAPDAHAMIQQARAALTAAQS